MLHVKFEVLLAQLTFSSMVGCKAINSAEHL